MIEPFRSWPIPWAGLVGVLGGGLHSPRHIFYTCALVVFHCILFVFSVLPCGVINPDDSHWCFASYANICDCCQRYGGTLTLWLLPEIQEHLWLLPVIREKFLVVSMAAFSDISWMSSALSRTTQTDWPVSLLVGEDCESELVDSNVRTDGSISSVSDWHQRWLSEPLGGRGTVCGSVAEWLGRWTCDRLLCNMLNRHL